MKCKQADLVSIYTSFRSEINKDGQGRDGKSLALGVLCFLLCCSSEEKKET